jgi:hypothetical protein
MLTLALDTKGPFGTLTAQRTITIEDPLFTRVAQELVAARGAGNAARAASLSKKLLAARHSPKIRPGQEVLINKPNSPDAVAPAEFKPKIRWFPEKDRLRVAVDVIDSNYAAAKDEEKRKYRAHVNVFVCASGADDDICSIYMLQGDKPDKPYLSARQGGRYSESETCPVKGTWKRTPRGYTAEVRIPWSFLSGYRKGWTVMPVEAKVLRKAKDWSYFVMTAPGEPDTSARTYSLLTAR